MAKGSTNTIVVVGGKSGASSFTVPSCANVTARSASGKIYIKWTDPDNIYDGGKLISWTKSEVRLIVSSSSDDDAYPKKVTDGTLVGTFTTKNQYKTTELEFTPPSTIGSDANCRIMVYAHCSIAGDTKDYVNGEYEAQASAQFQIKSYSTWTVVIDESNSNPLSCCTYADDAVGMTKGSSDWDSIFGYRPCVMQNGAVIGYLNPNDFTEYENGNMAPITNINYDVMIEFPRMGLTISKSGTQVTISLTNNPNDSNFEYRAHKRGDVQKNAFYLGAYDACSISPGNNIGSYSNTTPYVNISASDIITYAHNHGSGYEIMAFYQWTYIQCLYVLKYGNLNSQLTIGSGWVDSSYTRLLSSGTLNDKGMNYGTSDGVKLFGLEHFWGNMYQILSGIYKSTGYVYYTTTKDFTLAGASFDNWEYSGASPDAYTDYISQVVGSIDLGLISSYNAGSTTTYYCDEGGGSTANTIAHVGGNSISADTAGIFCGYFNASYSYVAGDLGARLMYL